MGREAPLCNSKRAAWPRCRSTLRRPSPELTFEAWVNPEAEGGTVATIGDGALVIDLAPATGTVRVWINGRSAEGASASIATDQWAHIAVVFNADVAADEAEAAAESEKDADAGTSRRKWDTAGGGGPGGDTPGSGGADTLVVYVDAIPIISTTADQPIDAEQLIIGGGLRGRIGDVRLWNVARSASELYADRERRLNGTENNLSGYWPLTEGSGQVLDNEAGNAEWHAGALDGS